ncbi:DUF2586 domain-containing protein [Vibrio diazotrophicus]|uniref:DUF2586 domain-containing protein n=1 Tax=Vibrio diazotrophicus TaxID=685 RepID=UPI000C9E67C6|nr:DUF2586 domain-containing protein [Vibrio diazotrophicus]PNH93104.1 DUF2586 domain-containing protein [Vibrio diazotrophicus]
MAWPTVIIKILNLMNGPIAGVEYHFLYVIYGTVEGTTRNLISVDATTDLDDALKDANPEGLANLKAAQLNGKSEWTAGVMILDQADNWQDAVKKANEVDSFELVVLAFDATKEIIESAIALRTELKSSLGREVGVLCQLPIINNDPDQGKTWAEWSAATVAIVDGIASEYVSVVANVHKDGDTLGKYAGRLANQEVSLADSPARVQTGSVLGSTELMTDKDGKALELATLKLLNSNRLSVPMWYPDYAGQYWTTGSTLDVAGGDYQDIRHIRVAMKAARKVRIRGIARIADRTFNSTPSSTAAAKLYFTKDLREMALTGVPGEILPPEDEDIDIKWVNKTDVEIYMSVQPYDCPVKITIAISIKQGATS